MLSFAYFSFKPASSHNDPGCTSTTTDLRSPSNLCICSSPVITPAVSGLPHYRASPCSVARPRGLVIDKRCTKQPSRLDRVATEAQWTCEGEWRKFIRAQQHRI